MHTPDDQQPSDARLPDDVYDAFVVWIDERDDDMFATDLTVISGAHKGDVVCVVAARKAVCAGLGVGMHADALDLVGVPCTLHVEHGQPRIARA
jgi:hypothetical protein